MKLNLRPKPKKRLPSRLKEPLVQPLHPNMIWSMDFMSDAFSSGRAIRTFNIMDDFNREALHIALDFSINSKRVIRQLESVCQWRGYPEKIRVDNGPEFIAHAMKTWCKKKGIELHYIQKGKPMQNGFVERFNRTYRDEVLDLFAFESLRQARQLTQAWMWMYNNERPHDSIGNVPPAVFLARRSTNPDVTSMLGEPETPFEILIKNVAA